MGLLQKMAAYNCHTQSVRPHFPKSPELQTIMPVS